MKSSASSLSYYITFGFAGLIALAIPSVFGGENTAPAARSSPTPVPAENQLLLTGGKIAGMSVNGQSVPATLRNVVDELQRRYPAANINLIEADRILIGRNLNLRLVPRPEALFGVLKALEEASGHSFHVDAYGEQDFVITSVAETSRSTTEVFNLTVFLSHGNPAKAELEKRFHDLEIEQAALRARYDEKHPRMTEIASNISVVKAQIAAVVTPSKEDVNKLLEQIRVIVEEAVMLSPSKEKAPEFQFHAGTNLLVVTGSDAAVDVARKVVHALDPRNN